MINYNVQNPKRILPSVIECMYKKKIIKTEFSEKLPREHISAVQEIWGENEINPLSGPIYSSTVEKSRKQIGEWRSLDPL